MIVLASDAWFSLILHLFSTYTDALGLLSFIVPNVTCNTLYLIDSGIPIYVVLDIWDVKYPQRV